MFEHLEPRRFLSVTLNPWNQVQVTGSEAADDVSVRVRGRDLVVTENGHETAFKLRDVTLVEVSGGGGDDRIVVDRGVLITSRLVGGDGNDFIVGGGGISWIEGGAGNDMLFGGDGADSLSGGDGDDHLWGGAGGDSLSGNAGDDRIHGGDGKDSASGGSGADLLTGGAGDDALQGDDNRDVLAGNAGNDRLGGGDGNDRMAGGAGDDTLSDTRGVNAFIGNGGADQATLAPGAQQTAGLELKVHVDGPGVLDDYRHDLALRRDADGNVTADLLVRLSDSSYHATFGELTRDGNAFEVNVAVESTGGGARLAIVEVRENYDLGRLAPGRYTFAVRTSQGVDAVYTIIVPGRVRK